MNRSLAFALILAAGCSGGGTPTGGTSTGEGSYGALGMTSAMSIRLVDAPSDDVKEIVVTINRVTAHVVGGGGWVDLANQTATVDLLTLQGGTFAQLGVISMPAGKVTELRLYTVDAGPNYVTTPDGVHHPLTVPSGDESGIKIKGGFDVPACAQGNITLDFDGKKSIFTHPLGAGAGDEWMLRPVVRLKEVAATGTCSDGGSSTPPPPGSGGGGDGDLGMTPASGSDGGMTPIGGSGGGPVIVSDPTDPCLTTVICPDGSFCSGGVCVTTAPIG
jgi:hypothetical protein